MRWICCVAAPAGASVLAGPAAAYQPVPSPPILYEYQVIPSYRGQACTMPPTFTPGPICCEPACPCCLHVWDNYCQRKQYGCRIRCGGGGSRRTATTGREIRLRLPVDRKKI